MTEEQNTVICRASFRGEVTKEQLYFILNYIDDMKGRGYSFEKHDRIDMLNGNVKINYVLVLYQGKEEQGYTTHKKINHNPHDRSMDNTY